MSLRYFDFLPLPPYAFRHARDVAAAYLLPRLFMISLLMLPSMIAPDTLRHARLMFAMPC